MFIAASIVGAILMLAWFGIAASWLTDHVGGVGDHWYGLPLGFIVAMIGIAIFAACVVPFA